MLLYRSYLHIKLSVEEVLIMVRHYESEMFAVTSVDMHSETFMVTMLVFVN